MGESDGDYIRGTDLQVGTPVLLEVDIVKQWEQALEFAAEVQAQQVEPTPATPGRYGLSQSLTHPSALMNPSNPLATRPDALAHATAGLGITDIGLSQESPATSPPEPAVDIEPER